MDGQLAVLDRRHVVIFQVKDLIGVLDDGAGVGSEKVLDRVVLSFGVKLRQGARRSRRHDGPLMMMPIGTEERLRRDGQRIRRSAQWKGVSPTAAIAAHGGV